MSTVMRGGRLPRTLLEKLIWQREATYEEQVSDFLKLARQLNEPATITVRHLQRLAAGQRSAERAAPSTRRIMRQLYGHPLDDLVRPVTTTAIVEPLTVKAVEPVVALPVDADLDRIASISDSAQFLGRLTELTLAGPETLGGVDVMPGMWQAAVVRWLVGGGDRQNGPENGREITNADVEIVRHATRMFASWDYQWGGGRSRLLVAQCLANDALPLLRYVDAGSTVGREYLCAVSALTRLAGWTAYDMGLHGAAQQFMAMALNFAGAAGDRALGGRILAGMSHQANFLGQYQRAVELARAAHQGAASSATPTAMSLFFAMEARAHASLGAEPECTRALQNAESQLSLSRPENDPDWIHFFDAAELHAEFAHCFRDLGHAVQAERHAVRSIEESEPFYVRSLSFCRTVLATAQLQRREVETAIDTAREVVDTASNLRSQRIAAYLDEFWALLAPFSSSAAVRDFSAYARERRPALSI